LSVFLDYFLCEEEVHVAQFVEELSYKPEGCGFNSRWWRWSSSWT